MFLCFWDKAFDGAEYAAVKRYIVLKQTVYIVYSFTRKGLLAVFPFYILDGGPTAVTAELFW